MLGKEDSRGLVHRLVHFCCLRFGNRSVDSCFRNMSVDGRTNAFSCFRNMNVDRMTKPVPVIVFRASGQKNVETRVGVQVWRADV